MQNEPQRLVFQLDEKPPLAQWILFGFQNVVVAFAVMIGVPLALSAALKLAPGETTVLVSGVMIGSGILCLIQSLGAGPLGGRLPLVNAPTFKFMGPMLAAYKVGGMPALFGATFLGGFIEVGLAMFAGTLRKLFSPFLVSSFLTIVGVSLLPIGLKSLFSVGKAYQGSAASLIAAAATLALVGGFAVAKNKTLRALSILMGIAGGYVVGALLGLVDWAPVRAAAWFGMYAPFKYGMPTWPGLSVFLAMAIVWVVCFVEAVGDTTAVAAMTDADLTTSRLRGSLIADGLSGPISAIFNGLPMTTYGQNVGLIKLTGVGSRFVVAAAAVIFIVMGLIPKLAAVISVMPTPVLGASLVVSFGMIAIEGIRRLGAHLESPRNAVVLTLGLGATLAVWTLPAAMLAALPGWLAPFLTDAMIAGLLTTLLLDLLLPKVKQVDAGQQSEVA